MRAQASIEFLLIASAIAAMSLGVVAFYAKNVFSQASALARVANASPGGLNFTAPPLAGHPATTTIPFTAYSAVISGRNEKLAYGISAPSYIVNLTQNSHCTYTGFFGHPYNTTGQCGTSSAWDYIADYNCWTTGAFCIIPHNTSYGVETTSAQRTYVYNFTLTINSPLGVLRSEVSSGAGESPVSGSNRTIGYAAVTGVVSVEPVPSLTLYSNGGSYSQLNQSAYGRYAQEKNILFPMLSFYNGTSVDPATQQAIVQTVSAFAKAARALVGSRADSLACAVRGGAYACNANYPFLYLINVTLAGVGSVNQTLYYLGSVVMVHGG